METSTRIPLEADCEHAAKILKALSHPQRLLLLCHLTQGERPVGELVKACSIPQSVVSQSLIRMRAEGLVLSRKQGTFVFYRLADPKITKLIKSLHKIFSS